MILDISNIVVDEDIIRWRYRNTGCVVFSRIDIKVSRQPLLLARPGDHEVAGRINRHRWLVLISIRVEIDLKLGSLGNSGGVVPLRKNSSPVPILICTFPSHDVIP